MNSILAKKIEQSQKFLENGVRIPVTKLGVNGNVVVRLKTLEKDLYSAVQLGFEKKVKAPKGKSPTSSRSAGLRGASTKSPFRFLREVRMADTDALPAVGTIIKASEIFKPGDIINVTGISKGKGYAGVVKRYRFKGGPRTHGQSDRERAPGSIGSSTTPGRVYRGKRMAGRMGHDQVTVKNLRVVFIDDNYILVKGLVPGGRNTLLMIKKVGEDKKFVPLFSASEKLSDSVVVASNATAAREVSNEKTATTETQKKDETLKGDKNAS